MDGQTVTIWLPRHFSNDGAINQAAEIRRMDEKKAQQQKMSGLILLWTYNSVVLGGDLASEFGKHSKVKSSKRSWVNQIMFL